MKKIKKKCLDELANMVELISNEYQMAYVGGGDGTFFDPYEWEEYCSMSDNDLTQKFYYYDEFYVRCWHDGVNCIVFGSYGSGSYGSGSYGYGSYSNDDDNNYTSWSDYLTALGEGKWYGGYVMQDGVAVYIGPDDSINNKNTGGDGNSDIVRRAEQYYGTKYKSGGMGTNGIDCSGLVSRALGYSTHVWTTKDGKPPRGTYQVDYANYSDLRPGDIICWEGHHAAIYVGGGEFIHAGEKGNVCHQPVDASWIPRSWGRPVIYRAY